MMKKLLVRFSAALVLTMSTLGIAYASPTQADTASHERISAPNGAQVSTGFGGCRGTFDQNILRRWGGLAWARFKPYAGATCHEVTLTLWYVDTAGQIQRVYGEWSPGDEGWVAFTGGALWIDRSYMIVHPLPPHPSGDVQGDWGYVTAVP